MSRAAAGRLVSLFVLHTAGSRTAAPGSAPLPKQGRAAKRPPPLPAATRTGRRSRPSLAASTCTLTRCAGHLRLPVGCTMPPCSSHPSPMQPPTPCSARSSPPGPLTCGALRAGLPSASECSTWCTSHVGRSICAAHARFTAASQPRFAARCLSCSFKKEAKKFVKYLEASWAHAGGRTRIAGDCPAPGQCGAGCRGPHMPGSAFSEQIP